MAGDSPEALARIIEGVIVGMGFIGGGAILQMKHSVRGTATAASLWVTGAMGVSVGLGALDVAVMLAVATFATCGFSRRSNHPIAARRKLGLSPMKRGRQTGPFLFMIVSPLNRVPAPEEAGAAAAEVAAAGTRPSPGSPIRPGRSASPEVAAEAAGAEAAVEAEGPWRRS